MDEEKEFQELFRQLMDGHFLSPAVAAELLKRIIAILQGSRNDADTNESGC